MLRVGSLCSGYGGLEMGIEQAFGPIDLRFVSDIDKDVNTLLAHHRADVPNLGDLKTVDWEKQDQIDLLCAGYPCQPFSTAGHRKGLEDERAIFGWIADGISVLRPRNLLLENVAGHLTLGSAGVVAELARLGYDAKWGIVRASDAGAAHQRARLFIWAEIKDAWSDGRYKTATGEGREGKIRPSRPVRSVRQESTDTDSARLEGCIEQGTARLDKNVPREQPIRERHVTESYSAFVTNSTSRGLQELRAGDGLEETTRKARRFDRFGPYEPAIRRWEQIMGRPAPYPVDYKGIEPVFVEWMMGLPKGHVTSLGLSRTAELKMLGNGVVPQQAALALHYLTQERASNAA
mgnify:CR=1 FL=1